MTDDRLDRILQDAGLPPDKHTFFVGGVRIDGSPVTRGPIWNPFRWHWLANWRIRRWMGRNIG